MPRRRATLGRPMIREAAAGDFERLREIEVLAGEVFRTVGMDFIADMPPPPVEVLAEFTDAGRCWVAVGDGVVGGYLLAEVVDGCAHIAQVSVDPRFRGRRLGARLIDHLDGWTREHGLAALTLATYRDLAWNGVYYAKIGFGVVEPTPGLAELVAREAKLGLDPALRVCMRR
ncbi:GNAT family N-acetyltransferase [Actinokineospora sp.]|uniref:GNAT family N-acetyltransferase n=1 Tax=Actinokineospora sp. TaxID=1872133 RepID=UPI003D6BA64F